MAANLTIVFAVRNQRRRQEEQRRVLLRMKAAREAQDEVLALMSHEIRNPAHVITQCATFLTEHLPLNHEARPDLDAILLSAETMHRLINDIINFTALRKGALEVRWGVVDVRALVAAVAKAHAGMAAVPLTYTVAPDTPLAIVSDATRLHQIISNGMTNAAKFCTTGRISLSLAVERDATDVFKGMVVFTIRDTGAGPSTWIVLCTVSCCSTQRRTLTPTHARTHCRRQGAGGAVHRGWPAGQAGRSTPAVHSQQL